MTGEQIILHEIPVNEPHYGKIPYRDNPNILMLV